MALRVIATYAVQDTNQILIYLLAYRSCVKRTSSHIDEGNHDDVKAFFVNDFPDSANSTEYMLK